MISPGRQSLPARLALVACLCLPAVSSLAADPADVLARIAQAGKGVRTVRARFVQEKRLAMFRNPLVSKGEFTMAKPGRLRWEVLEPVRSGFLVNGRQGKRWFEEDPPEPFDVARDPVMGLVTGQLMAWASADTAALARDYVIEVAGEGPVTLNLRPAGGGKGPVARLVVSFSDDLTHVALVEIHERDGDMTRITFTGATVNEDLPPDTF
jgi:outer membrane lipoprotein-sorting protein